MKYEKYTLLTLGQYIALNNAISEAKGYDLSKSTQRVYPTNPELAKINIEIVDGVETYDLVCGVKITGSLQDNYPDVANTLELVDNYTHSDDVLTEIIAVELTTEQVDWYLQHYAEVGNKSINSIVVDNKRTELSDLSVQKLNADDISIISKSNTVKNKYCVIKKGDIVLTASFIEGAKIETTNTVEEYETMDIPSINLTDLPTSGIIEKNKLYNYEGKPVLCRQTHIRTIYTPEQTPALFSFYRENLGELEWIEGEAVEVGWKRMYNGEMYEVTQKHQTQLSWTPDVAVTLWSLIPSSNEWSYPVAYNIGDEVSYLGITYKCLQAHTSNSSWKPSIVPALWDKQ